MDNPVNLATLGTQYEGIKSYQANIFYRSVVLFEESNYIYCYIAL